MIELISKTPEPGWCKTRIGSIIGSEKAAQLQEALLNDSFRVSNHQKLPVRIWLGSKMENDSTLMFPKEYKVHRKMNVTLGEIIECASVEPTDSKFKILVGVDSPHALFQHLPTAIELLRENSRVLGPTEDGGVYLIGFQIGQNKWKDVDWGTDKVFRQLYSTDSVILSKEMDIDRMEELTRFQEIIKSHPEWAPSCAELLRKWNNF